MRKTTILFRVTACLLFLLGISSMKAQAVTEPDEYSYYTVKSGSNTPYKDQVWTENLTGGDSFLEMQPLAGEPADNQLFRFIPSGNTLDGNKCYYIQIQSEGKKYVKNADWKVDPSDEPSSEYWIDSNTGNEGYVYIRRKNGSQSLGLDNNTGSLSNPRIYADKGSDGNSKWMLEKGGQMSEDVIREAAVEAFDKALEKAETALATESSWGFSDEVKAELEAAIEFAKTINKETISLEDLNAETIKLNTLAADYLMSEIVPRWNANPDTKYRLMIAEESSPSEEVRYISIKSGSDKGLVPKPLDLSANPDWQLFQLEAKEGGAIDEYYIKNVTTGQYIISPGIWASGGKSGTWIAEYKVSNDDGIDFFALRDANGNRWGAYGGEWPDNVNQMYHSGGYVFAIIPNPGPFDNLKSLIEQTKAQLEVSTSNAALKTYLSSAVAKAEGIKEGDAADVIEKGLTDLQEAINLSGEYENTIKEAQATLEIVSEYDGFPQEAKEALQGTIDKTLGVDYFDAQIIQSEIDTLKAAIQDYLLSEIRPRWKANPNAKYRIMIAKEKALSEVRYMSIASESNFNVIPKALDTTENPDWQLFVLEPKDGGAIDEYYIKNVFTGKYLNSPGISANGSKSGTWVAEYKATNEENGTDFFVLHANSLSGGRWGIQSGTWPDAVTQMYESRGSEVFAIVRNPESVEELQQLIQEAKELITASQNPEALKTYLNNVITEAEKVEEGDNDGILSWKENLNAAVELFNEYANALLDAETVLETSKTSPYGFPQEATETFEAAIEAAKKIAETDEESIRARIQVLSEAVRTYKAAENKPFINAIDGATYRLLISDGTDVRYMTVGENGILPAAKDEANPSAQLFYLELKEKGELDEYYIRSVADNQYLNAAGTALSAKKDATWNAEFEIKYNDIAYFKFLNNNDPARFWSTNEGTWPDAVTSMGNGVAGGISTFAVEYVAPNMADLQDIITETENFVSTTQVGATDGKYPEKAKQIIDGAIAEAKGFLTSQSQIAVDEATEKLTKALDTYKKAKITITRTALENRIKEADELFDKAQVGAINGNYSAEGKNAFEIAIGAAKMKLSEQDVTQTDIDTALAALNEAIAAFEATRVVVDFEELDMLTSSAERYAGNVNDEGNEVLAQAKVTFEEAIATAAETDRNSVAQEDVTEIIATLQSAFETFIAAVKVDLLEAIAMGEQFIVNNQVPETETQLLNVIDRITLAISEAKNLEDNVTPEEVTQAILGSKISDIEEGIADFEKVLTVSLTNQIIEIDKVMGTADEGEAKTALKEVLDNAQEVLNKESLTYEEYKATTEALEKALLAFLGFDLNQLINEVQKFVDEAEEGNKAGQYPTKSNIQKAIDEAKAFIENAAKESDFAKEVTKLQTAFDNFKETIVVDTSIDMLEGNGIFISTMNGKLYVTGLNDAVTISGYDLSGRMVFTETSSEGDYERSLSVGNYIISIKGYVNGSKLVIVK